MTMRTIATTFLAMIVALAAFGSASAQTTEFTYQGTLKDGANPANGNYDLEFRLYDAVTNGTQVGPLVTRSNVAVVGGNFGVKLDFGNTFAGPDRFLEIRVRNAGSGGYTALDPRQKVGSSPYAVKSLAAESANTANSATTATTAASATNSLQLGGVAANQFVQTSDPRLSDARPPTSGSSNYIQNSSIGQASGNFNISGDGTVGGTISGNIVRANSQFNFGSNAILRASGNVAEPFSNTFNGVDTGTNTVPGNLSGENNSFFGNKSGKLNISGRENSFFGFNSGSANSVGNGNSFFGTSSGRNNNQGIYNTFVGAYSGQVTTNGQNNTFVGANSGQINVTGSNNTAIGADTQVAGLGELQYATAIGAGAVASNSNTITLGRAADSVLVQGGLLWVPQGRGDFSGFLNTNTEYRIGNSRILSNAGTRNSFLGVGSGAANTGTDNSFFGSNAGTTNTSGSNNTAIGSGADLASGSLSYATAVGAGAVASISNSIFLGRQNGSDAVRIPGAVLIDGSLVVSTLGSAGSTSVCLNAASRLSPCSSSLKYKTNISRFGFGLSLIKQLRPITFDWKDGGMHDLGLGAEDVAAIEPLLVTYNSQGVVEGVKYDRIGVVLINAVKEQQVQLTAQQNAIDGQKAVIAKQQAEIAALKALVCRSNKKAAICRVAR